MVRHKKNYTRNKGKKFSKPHFNENKLSGNNGATNKRNKNFRFIQRSKEAEEQQRQQKIIEDKYKQQVAVRSEEDDSDREADQVEEENPFESLLSTFNKNENNLIESSSDEEQNQEDDVEDTSDELEEDENGVNKQSEEGDDVSFEGVDDDLEEVAEEEEEFDEDSDENENAGESDCEEDDLEEQNDEEEEEAEIDDEIEQMKSHQILDPFAAHFEGDLSQQHVDNLLAKRCPTKKSELSWPRLGRMQIEISESKKESTTEEGTQPKKKKKLLIDEEQYAQEGSEPQLIALQGNVLEKFSIKQQILKNVSFANKEFLKDNFGKPLTPLQTEILSIVSNYQDLSFPQRSFENAEELRFVYCLHALNHILKTRAKVLHHNAKLNAGAENKKASNIIPDAYQDQGFVRPKVLIVLPFRDSAFKLVNFLVNLLYGDKSEISKTDGTVINYKRFTEEYTGNTIYFPKTNPKPEDYENTFSGNTDDNFKIGISFTKKCIKLYTEFYSSDIIVASPLGLRMVVGAAGDTERDYDFLTSIEVLILDQAELFLAQNWDHLLHVLDHMHLQPQSTRNTDFSRVRPWCLNGLSRFYRQTLLFTSHELPEFRSLFNSKCSNYQGKVRVVNPIIDGSIRNVFVHIPQVFHKIDVQSIESLFDKRFKYFIDEMLPQFKGPSMAHCMIYVPSYFDYVRLRNHFKSETINFVQICEYTKDAKIARARDMFFHSAAHFLLYSERAHFFRRTRIKGIRHLIFYQPPCWPHLYPELINLMQESNQNSRDGLESSMSVTILYTKYDMLQVSALIGTERASKLLRANKTTHIFTSGL